MKNLSEQAALTDSIPHSMGKGILQGWCGMYIHVVGRGDTVWSVARQYNVSPQRIIRDNHVVNPQNLVVGQALLILVPEVTYTVKAGDTLASVAGKFGVSSIVLLQNNPELIGAPYLRAGQTITISFQAEKLRNVTINAYAYPYINRDILRHTLPYLTYLTIFGYGFTLSGELIEIEDQPLINMAYEYRTAPVMLLSSITEDGNFNSERASLLFQNLELQNKVLDNVIAVMLEKGYVGLDIDFEFIEAKDAEAYLQFLENARVRLHAHGFFLHTDLAPKTSAGQRGLLYEAHNYARIGAIADTVLIMTYEWGYTYGPPMAVAPIDKVREVVSYAVTEIEPRKILMGIPNYGYDWILPFEKGTTRATTIGNDYAVEIAARNNVPIQFDQTAQSPFFEYWGRRGEKHVVWFEDVRSIRAKFNLMDEFQLLGGGYWNAMRPFTQNWAYVGAMYHIRKVVP